MWRSQSEIKMKHKNNKTLLVVKKGAAAFQILSENKNICINIRRLIPQNL